jgi:hypothetical protein
MKYAVIASAISLDRWFPPNGLTRGRVGDGTRGWRAAGIQIATGSGTSFTAADHLDLRRRNLPRSDALMFSFAAREKRFPSKSSRVGTERFSRREGRSDTWWGSQLGEPPAQEQLANNHRHADTISNAGKSRSGVFLPRSSARLNTIGSGNSSAGHRPRANRMPPRCWMMSEFSKHRITRCSHCQGYRSRGKNNQVSVDPCCTEGPCRISSNRFRRESVPGSHGHPTQ